MNLDKLLSLYKCLAKRQALNLPESSRTTACQWIQKLETVPAAEEHEKKVLLHALKLLLLSFERRQLIGPFENTPEETEFTEFNWLGLKLNDFVKMVDKKDLDRRECPKFSYGVSGNRRVLTTFQNDPLTGQHCYYACSSEPVERWDNLEGGAIPHDTVETWRQNGEWDVLNEKGSENPSIDIPRCQPPEGAPDTDFVVQNEGNTKQSKYYRRNQGAPEKSQPGHSILRTPKRFGGTIQARKYYPEEFGINQSEYFRSPRAVFENPEYDQWQAPQGESRLTDSKKMAIRTDSTSIEKETFRDKARARLQNIRNGMNQPARVEVQPEIELEPNAVHYENISLHEPSDEYDHVYIEDDVHSLGILSSDAMYDKNMFGVEKVVDPNSIFKNKNVNLVSRNVVKLETNTTISGNERKVTEEFLEREDVNINKKRTSDNDLMKTSKSPSPIPAHDVTQHRPFGCSHRPRKIPVDEDLYQRNESAYSPADHGQFTKHSDVYGSSRRRQLLLERANQSLVHKTNKDFRHGQEDSSCKVQRGQLAQVNISERLTDVCQPSFLQSFDDYEYYRSDRNPSRRERRYLSQVDSSERLEDVYQPDFPQSFDESTASRARADRRHLPQVDSTERLTDVCQPSFPTSFQDSCQRSEKSPSRTGQSHLPQVDISERLEDIYQPEFPESFQDSRHRSEGSRRTGDRSRLPQVDVSERLTDVCEPSFPTSYEESRQKSERSPRRKEQGYLPQVDISERLEDVYQPEFPESFQDSRHRSEGNKRRGDRSRLPQVDVSERLTDVCEPSFPTSYEESRQKSERSPRRKEQGYLPQVDISERLEDVYQPEFPESFQDSRHRSEGNKRRGDRSRLPQVDVSERLTDVCEPSFPTSYEESRSKPEKSQRRTEQGYLPQVDISERLEDVYQPEFPESFQDSRHRSEGSRRTGDPSRLPQVDVSERLTDVCEPSFPTSYEESRQKSERSPRRTEQGYLPQVDISERLEDVYQPEFPESFQDSRHRSEGNKRRGDRSRLPQVDVSERLTDVCEPSFPTSYEESRQKSERSPRKKEQGYLPQVDISERLEDVFQPEFPESFQDSRHRSEGNRRRADRSRLPQVDVSERLTDVCQPSFPTSYEESKQKLEKSQRITEQGYLPQVDFSERLEDVYQPEFPESFQDSRHRSEGNRQRADRSRLPQVDKQHQSEYSPEGNLGKISDPVIIFDQQHSTRRSPRHIPLHSRNLEDISHPPQSSPRQRLKASLQRGPSRMPFPKKDPVAAQPQITERLGDYREPFRSMANYAPFQEQINPQCIQTFPRGFTTKLKLPGTFGRSREIPLATSTSRIQPPIRHMQQQGRPPAVSRSPSRSKSPHETFRLVAPIKRTQMQHPETAIPRREQSARIAKPSEQEHLIKKSTVKIQVTKSTYSKDELNGPQKSQRLKK